jgi:meiotically up-regulated gene 157 (Mug157) protein
MGFVERDDAVYQNTRKMLLAKEGNPYFLEGPAFQGIGGMFPFFLLPLPFPLLLSPV